MIIKWPSGKSGNLLDMVTSYVPNSMTGEFFNAFLRGGEMTLQNTIDAVSLNQTYDLRVNLQQDYNNLVKSLWHCWETAFSSGKQAVEQAEQKRATYQELLAADPQSRPQKIELRNAERLVGEECTLVGASIVNEGVRVLGPESVAIVTNPFGLDFLEGLSQIYDDMKNVLPEIAGCILPPGPYMAAINVGLQRNLDFSIAGTERSKLISTLSEILDRFSQMAIVENPAVKIQGLRRFSESAYRWETQGIFGRKIRRETPLHQQNGNGSLWQSAWLMRNLEAIPLTHPVITFPVKPKAEAVEEDDVLERSSIDL